MDCSTTCQKMEPISAPLGVIEAAEKLACLLVETPELQNFVQLARAIRIDEEAAELLNQMQGFNMVYEPDAPSTEDLEAQLAVLPVMRDYRQAESAVKSVFGLVDRLVGETAGLAFAENAKPSACG